MWSRIPIPSTALGARCAPGPTDTASTPNRCLPGEENMLSGSCVPRPQTQGSDCSRCDNNWPLVGGPPAFAPPCPGCDGNRHDITICNVVLIPPHLAPRMRKYVLGWGYDCQASSQVWDNCADVTLASTQPPPPPAPAVDAYTYTCMTIYENDVCAPVRPGITGVPLAVCQQRCNP